MSEYLSNILSVKLKRTHCAGDIGDEWQTPEDEFNGIEKHFNDGKNFAIDLFTDGEFNSKCNNFFTAKDNALNQDWGIYCKLQGVDPVGFANPPYSKRFKGVNDEGISCTGLSQMMKKAFIEMQLGFKSVWVLPCNPEADWFPYQTASKIRFITGGRLTFDVPQWYKQDKNGSKPSSARGGSCLYLIQIIIIRVVMLALFQDHNCAA